MSFNNKREVIMTDIMTGEIPIIWKKIKQLLRVKYVNV